jgi:hypothetical protein
LTPDELVEAGLRQLFLGEPLPASLGMLEHMADPGVDREALVRAFALDEPACAEVVRLHLVEGLVGGGNAQAVTRCEVGAHDGGVRQVSIEWLEPRVYDDVEPRGRSDGSWRIE